MMHCVIGVAWLWNLHEIAGRLQQQPCSSLLRQLDAVAFPDH